MNYHYNPHLKIHTETVSVPQLKKGDMIPFYGAIFEMLEDSYNCYHNDKRLESERLPIERQTFGCKAKFHSYSGGGRKGSNVTLENIDWFQGNSFARYARILPPCKQNYTVKMILEKIFETTYPQYTLQQIESYFIGDDYVVIHCSYLNEYEQDRYSEQIELDLEKYIELATKGMEL